MKTIYKQLFYLLVAVLFVSCSGNEANTKKPDDKLNIVVTTGMIADIVEHVAGSEAKVTSLMKPGVDPHQYQAVQSDLELLEHADIIFYNGIHLEGKMADLFEKMSKYKKVYAFSDAISTGQMRKVSENDAYDPHFWMDVSLWTETIRLVKKQLIKVDYANKAYYESNAMEYEKVLRELDKEVKRKIAEIPVNQRVLVTAHDAFGYFGDAYDIKVVGLQGISTVSEASIKHIQEIANLIIERDIQAIFVETSVPKKQMERLIESCKEHGHAVAIGGNLYSDAMGPENTSEGTYVGMIEANVNTIVTALKH